MSSLIQNVLKASQACLYADYTWTDADCEAARVTLGNAVAEAEARIAELEERVKPIEFKDTKRIVYALIGANCEGAIDDAELEYLTRQLNERTEDPK